MKELNSVRVGDILYHHTDKPCEQFSPEACNVVYFGKTPESVELVGGVGFLMLYQVINELGQKGEYGSRSGWGSNGDWISMPAEIAAESLQFFDQETEDGY